MIAGRHGWLATVVVAGLLFSLAARSYSQPAPHDEDDEDGWHFGTMPMFWAAGLDGDVSIKGNTANVDASFSDILEHTEQSFATYLELRKGKFGVFASPLYLKLTGDQNGSVTEAEITSQLWIAEFGGYYRISDVFEVEPVKLDLLLAGRYWDLHNDLKITTPGSTFKGSSTQTLLDPVVGIRVQNYLDKRLQIMLRGDAGGFGISNDTSNISWQAMGLLGYDLTKRFSVWAGYRALSIDTEEGGDSNKNGVNVIMSGVVLGLQINW